MHEPITNEPDSNGEQAHILLTIDEARDVLRISRWSLYQLINGRRLKTIRIGRRRLIAAEDLRALLDDLRREGASYGR